MAVNKVELSTGEILIDISGVTVTPETMLEGTTSLNSAGEEIVGTLNLNEYQKKTDESLETESKKVVDAINEVNRNTVYLYNATYSGNLYYYITNMPFLQSLPIGMTLVFVPDRTNSTASAFLLMGAGLAFGGEIMRPNYDGNDVTGFEIVEAQWLKANQPYRVMFDGTYWVLVDYPILSYYPDDTGGGGYPDETDYFLGTWVFNDTIALESVSDSFDFTVDNYGSSSETRYFNAMECTEDELYYSDVYESSPAPVYNGIDGWYDEPSLQTINIKTEPTDKAFKTWLYENAIKRENYYPDETDYFLGTWVFKDKISFKDFNDPFTFKVDMYYGSSYVEETLWLEGMMCASSELYYIDGSSDLVVCDESSGWFYEDYRTIIIETEPPSEDVRSWIYENAVKRNYPDDSGS